jgi:hypothetical protein
MSRLRTPRRWSCLALALVGGGCAPSPTPLTWRVELEDASLLARAAVVDARILRGGCGGPEVYGTALRPGGVMALAPPVLEAGVWGFAASAQDSGCVRFADVCDEIVLPGTTLVVSSPSRLGAEVAACAGARCDDGSCRTEDRDGDGVGVCLAGEPLGACDCDDGDGDVRPGAADACGDRMDEDCDGFDDECDVDCDGFPAGRDGVTDGRDCDDADAAVHPSGSSTALSGLADGDRLARGCDAMPATRPVSDGCRVVMERPEGDGVDQDCNGFVDDGPGCTDPGDRDRDGARACSPGVTSGCDPDDCDPGISPSRSEVCGNEIDEDGDGVVRPCDADDADGDGQRAVGAGGTDCDDGDPRTFLGAPDDCRTAAAESCAAPIGCAEQGGDGDGDGYVARAASGRGDCDDSDPAIRPFAGEDPCDGEDNDCDGVVDEVVRPRDQRPGRTEGCVRSGGGATPVDYDASSASSEYCGGCGIVTSSREDCCAGTPTAIDQPSQCGACGWSCGPHTRCDRVGQDDDGDVFACACAPGEGGRWTDCNGSLSAAGGDGCEVDLDTDERNCGDCGVRCELDNASEECVMGGCAVAACDAGFGDCDSVASTGCETPLTGLAGCGRCGETCSGVRNAVATCNASRRCDYTACEAGFADCDGDRTNGCEAATSSALTSCGSCTVDCNTLVRNANGRTCVMGMCGFGTCAAGFGDCDGSAANGCEQSLETTAHCGACRNACGPGESCSAGGDCTCGAAAAESGPACGAGASCVGGACVGA